MLSRQAARALQTRLGCKFLLDDGSLLYVHESQITPEIESLMASREPFRAKGCA